MEYSGPAFGGKAFRVAPGNSGEPTASFWKFWIVGKELYAMNRDAGSIKISVHASGQLHLRREQRDQQMLVPAMRIGASDWYHALEMRYLVGPGAFRPKPKPPKKNEKAFLVDTADGDALLLNLLVSAPRPTEPVPFPFSTGQTLWTSELTDGRKATLIARVMPIDDQSRERLNFFRGPDGPKVTLSVPTAEPGYLEHSDVHSSTNGGNVILIIPAGPEVIRVLDGQTTDNERAILVPVRAPSGHIDLRAPNGDVVATLHFSGVTQSVRLSKNEIVQSDLGTVRLVLYEGRLIRGAVFQTRVVTLDSMPSVGGRQPPSWAYPISCSFDGYLLTSTIRTQSAGVRPPWPLDQDLLASEEVVLVAPSKAFTIAADLDHPEVTEALEATLLLADIVSR
jgi:hypothetical protein